jgi:hypothetical protein
MTPAPEGSGERPRHLQPAPASSVETGGGSGGGASGADKLVDALRASADQELTIAERLASKARQAFALAAGVFVVSQTVAFGSFEAKNLGGHEKHWIIGLAIGAVVLLCVAAFATIKADAPVSSGDLPLADIENDLNAAYAGDDEVVGRLGGYYLGVVQTRRDANSVRRRWYTRARSIVGVSLLATVAELIVSLLARIS